MTLHLKLPAQATPDWIGFDFLRRGIGRVLVESFFAQLLGEGRENFDFFPLDTKFYSSIFIFDDFKFGVPPSTSNLRFIRPTVQFSESDHNTVICLTRVLT